MKEISLCKTFLLASTAINRRRLRTIPRFLFTNFNVDIVAAPESNKQFNTTGQYIFSAELIDFGRNNSVDTILL